MFPVWLNGFTKGWRMTHLYTINNWQFLFQSTLKGIKFTRRIHTDLGRIRVHYTLFWFIYDLTLKCRLFAWATKFYWLPSAMSVITVLAKNQTRTLDQILLLMLHGKLYNVHCTVYIVHCPLNNFCLCSQYKFMKSFMAQNRNLLYVYIYN